MIVKSLSVRNFRCIKEESLDCENLTALVGGNGSGKSTFLRAIDLFYAASPHLSIHDFYGRDQQHDIEIAVTFTDLTPLERERFESRLLSDELQVVRVFDANGGKSNGSYYGFTRQLPEFAEVRALSGREMLNAYRALKEKGFELSPVRSQADAEEELSKWEAIPENKDKLEYARDDGKFFGFSNVARGYLGDITKFIFIPAVRDAADDTAEGRGSAITTLMDLVVRTALTQKKEIAALKAEVEERYAALTDPQTLPELGNLESDLTKTLQTYYSRSAVSLRWSAPEAIELPPPRAEMGLVEDDFSIPVNQTGHGLQRAVILTLLQHLAVARGTSLPIEAQDNAEEAPEEGAKNAREAPKLNLILGIEEPELYQHPSRQRHFARVLFELAAGTIPGVAARTQVLYCTHSPLLVGVDRFNQIRCVRKIPGEDKKPKHSKIVGTTWAAVAKKIWEADGSPVPEYTETTIRPRVTPLMTPWMNEGFFADVVVLVEGEDDRAALLGVAFANKIDFESDGYSIIPCGGKASLDRPAVIFEQLAIPAYLVWDSDKCELGEKANSRIIENRRLLRLIGVAEEDWPSGVFDRFACFEVDLETTLKTEIGNELYDKLLSEEANNLGYQSPKAGKKNPWVIKSVFERAKNESGKEFQTILNIVEKIQAFRPQ